MRVTSSALGRGGSMTQLGTLHTPHTANHALPSLAHPHTGSHQLASPSSRSCELRPNFSCIPGRFSAVPKASSLSQSFETLGDWNRVLSRVTGGTEQGDQVSVCSDLGMARDPKGPLFEGSKDPSATQTHTWMSTKYQSMWIFQK